MLSKLLIFCFIFLAVFGLLFTFIPGEFWGTAGPQGTIQGQNFPASFKVQDILQFNSTINDTVATFPSEDIYDIGLGGQRLSVQWDNVRIGTYIQLEIFRLKHLTDQFLGYWWGQHDLVPYFDNGTQVLHGYESIVKGLERADVVSDWDSENNYSKFAFICPEGSINTVVTLRPALPNMTIAESWDAGIMVYTFGYAIDWSKVGYNAFSILGKLLSFQAPDLGIGGIGGTILGQLIAFMIWPMIAFIVYKVVMGIIPWVSGGSGD